VRRKLKLGDEHVGRGDRETDRREVAHRVVAQILIERRIDGEHADRADQQRVAVRVRPGDEFRGDGAVRAGPVFHDRRLAEVFLEL
jgi:hypothetical protein